MALSMVTHLSHIQKNVRECLQQGFRRGAGGGSFGVADIQTGQLGLSFRGC